MMVIYIFLVTANSEDERNKSDIMLNSLPITRRDIVLAKYVTVPVYILIGFTALSILAAVFKLPFIPLTPRFPNGMDILVTILVVGLYANFYLPFYFRYGVAALRFFQIIFFLAFFFIPSTLYEYAINNPDNPVVRFVRQLFAEQPSAVQTTVIIGLILIISLISYYISLRIYRAKEF
ncbi:MAG TPA: ABC-2 transporter permease, partial [Firmicutes bacterium]|nr:ABC-2 transporter permease [Bacillota bacterium]